MYLTIPIESNDKEIQAMVVAWSELLSKRKYSEALAMFPSVEAQNWTPDLLERTIQGFGVADIDVDTLKLLHEEWGVTEFYVSSLDVMNDKQAVVDAIEVDRKCLYGLNPDIYIGMVHYRDIPICESVSDLTARFHIKTISTKEMTLEFFDVHVM